MKSKVVKTLRNAEITFTDEGGGIFTMQVPHLRFELDAKLGHPVRPARPLLRSGPSRPVSFDILPKRYSGNARQRRKARRAAARANAAFWGWR